METEKVFSGRGCYRALANPPAGSTPSKPFDKYEVYVQCTEADGAHTVPAETSSVFLESNGSIGVQRLDWTKPDQNWNLFAPEPTLSTVMGCLAARMKRFDSGQVFVECKSVPADAEPVLVLRSEDQARLVGADAVLFTQRATPALLTELGYRIFVKATTPSAVVPQHTAVIHVSAGNDDDGDLQQLVISPSKFIVCPNTATTIAATLRANGVYYAALEAVYVRQTQFDDIDSLHQHGHKLLAVPVGGPKSAWSGPAIAVFSRETTFRAKFHVYAPCSGASQVLTPETSVMLDVEQLCQPLKPNRTTVILRYFPSPGMLNQDTQTHHGACISESGAQVRDKGYRDDDFLQGFRKGWYEDVYWRTVGDGDGRFLSGGVDGNNYKFNIHKEHGFGFDNRRVMIKLPNEGIVFCRGVSGDESNPEMACVLFNADGTVRENEAYKGVLGRWENIVQ